MIIFQHQMSNFSGIPWLEHVTFYDVMMYVLY